MSENKGQNYLHGAVILTAGVVIMKILGAIYKIPLGNLLTDEGYAHFMFAYSIYNVLLNISTAGLPVALSRMISEQRTLDRPNQVRKIFRVAFMTFLLLGTAGTVIMLLYPTELAAMMNNVEASQSVRALAPAVLISCMLAAYRGFIQGHTNMIPTTVSQVMEVLVKVVVGLGLAWIFTRQGKSLPIRSAGAIIGVSVGGAAALAYIVVYKRTHFKRQSAPSADLDVPESSGKILGTLLKIGIPITLGASVMSIITLIDTQIVFSRLQNSAGFNYFDTKILYGVYQKAITIFNLPAAFITPLTISVVPAIAARVTAKRRGEAKNIAESSLRIASILALPMGVGISVLADPIFKALYPDSNAAGPALLVYLGVASILVCLALMSNAILQAHGNERLPVYSMLAGGAAKIVVSGLLVGNPDINIMGAPIGTICCYLVMCVFNYIFLCRSLDERPSLSRIILRPAISCLVMGLAAWGVYGLVEKALFSGAAEGRIQLVVAMAPAILVAVVVYLIMIIATKAVTLEDIKLIPKGEKIAKLLKIK